MPDEVEPKELLPLLNSSFEPGDRKKTVESFSDPDFRRIAEAELYYFSGEAEKCTAITENYLEEEEISIRLSACLLYSFSNFTLGNAEAAQSGFQKIQETLKTVFAGNESRELQASCVFAASMTCILVRLPTDDLPPLRDYVRYLPAGLWILLASIFRLFYEILLGSEQLEIQIKTSDIQCYEYRKTDSTKNDKKISTTGYAGGTDFYKYGEMNIHNQTNHCEAVICLLCSSGYSEIVLRNF